MTTLFIDYESGNDNYAGTSFEPLASGTDGRASTYSFTAASANFPNDGTIVGQKNLLGSSERYDNNGAWSGAGFVFPLQLYDISPPSGLYTVWTFIENTATGTHSLRPNWNAYTLNTSLQYTISFYTKPYGRDIVVLRMGSSDTKGARFDIANGTILQTGASASAAISDAGDGWYRISLTATPTSVNEVMYFNLTDGTYTGTGEQNYAGDGMRGVLVTAAQLEASASVTSYEKPPEQYLSIFNGSIYAVYQLMSYISSTSLHLITIYGGTGNPSITVDRQYYIGGRWKTLSTSTGSTSVRIHPGDTFRLKASPDPTSIGDATWTGGIMASTKSISSSTNASPISVTVNNHGYSTGDTVFITGHATNLNANGMWEITVTGTNTFTLDGSTGSGTGSGGTVRLKNNAVVRLSSPLTQNIACTGNRGTGRTPWTASANAQTLFDTSDGKEGDVADYIGVTSAFTTGKVAYKTLSSTLDLSGYQQLSLWIKITSGNLNTTNNDVSIVLCSDSTGDVAVNTFNIPLLRALNRWTPFTIDLGTNLGSSINSVALYINNDRGAQVFYVSNIIACKASSSNDSLSLQSLISKNTSGETWYGIQSINGTRIILDNAPSAKTSEDYIRGYIGTSETVTTYKRETIKTDLATGATAFVQGINEVNYTETRSYIEGGWNRTDMSTQTGETVFDGLNGWGYGILTGANVWGACFNKIGCVRYYAGLYQHTGARYTRTTNCFSNNNDSFGFYLLNQSNDNYLNNLYGYCNGGTGVSIISFAYNPYISNCYFKSNRYDGIQSEHNYGIIDSCVCENNGRAGIYCSADYKKKITNCTTSYNNFGVYFSRSSEAFIKNLTTVGNLTGSVGADICGYVGISDSNLQEPAALGTTLGFAGNKIYFHNLDQIENNHLIGLEYGSIYSTASVTRSGNGYAWALAPTISYRSASYPLDLKISTFAVQANKLVNISAYVRRTNTNLTCRLRIPGGQIGGVTNDLISYATGAADTWEQVTMNFIPTENGVIDLFFEVYGGSTYTGYIDDLSIVQL